MNHVTWKMTRCQTRDLRTTSISIPSLARGVEEDKADSRVRLAGQTSKHIFEMELRKKQRLRSRLTDLSPTLRELQYRHWTIITDMCNSFSEMILVYLKELRVDTPVNGLLRQHILTYSIFWVHFKKWMTSCHGANIPLDYFPSSETDLTALFQKAKQFANHFLTLL